MLILSTQENNEQAELFASIFRSQGIRHKIIVDLPTAMRISKGSLNPNNGVIVVAPDGQHLRTMFDICAWIDEKGLRLL